LVPLLHNNRELLIQLTGLFLALRFTVVVLCVCVCVCTWYTGFVSDSTFVLIVYFFKALLWK